MDSGASSALAVDLSPHVVCGSFLVSTLLYLLLSPLMSLPAPKRTQTDGLSDEYSLRGAKSFDPKSDLARQEFKQDADVNHHIRRYGVQPLTEFPQGEHDFDVDLITAYTRASELRSTIATLPKEVLEAHGGVEAIVRGVLDGSIQSLNLPAEEGAGPPRPQPPAPEPKAEG